jgi:hypothetical protein
MASGGGMSKVDNLVTMNTNIRSVYDILPVIGFCGT